MFIWAAFKSHMEGSNVHLSVSITKQTKTVDWCNG